MNENVKEQIMAVRETGFTNMFDNSAVQRIAHESHYYDLVIFIEEHKDKYVSYKKRQYLRTGSYGGSVS